MRKIYTIIFLLSVLSAGIARAQDVAMDFTKNDCEGISHNLYGELDAGKVVILDYVMLGCSSCLVATDAFSRIAESYAETNPNRVVVYTFGYIKNYTCTQLTDWKNAASLNVTLFEDGAQQVAYYGGMGMPTFAVVGSNTHKVYFKKLGYTTDDDNAIRAAIDSALLYTPQSAGNDLRSVGITVSPTVFTGKVQVSLPRNLSGTVALFDASGRSALTQSFRDTRTIVLETGSLSRGIYFLQVVTEDGISGTAKVVRQ